MSYMKTKIINTNEIGKLLWMVKEMDVKRGSDLV